MIPTQPTSTPFQRALSLLRQLRSEFTVFGRNLPLAIGIDKQIIARKAGLDRTTLRDALRIHTTSLNYLKTMRRATVRFDLDANEAGEVTEVHRTHAANLFSERVKKDAQKKKAQREAEEEAQRRTRKLEELAAKFSPQR